MFDCVYGYVCMKFQEISTVKKSGIQAESLTMKGNCPPFLVLKCSSTEFYPLKCPHQMN